MKDDANQKPASATTPAAKEAGKPPYNTQPAGLEQWLDTTFNTKAPFQLPYGLRVWLADNAWWLVLVGAGLSLIGVLQAYFAMNATENFVATYGMRDMVTVSRSSVYVSVLISVLSAVLLFMASSKLKLHEKDGWNLLYYNFLLASALSLLSGVLFNPFGLAVLVWFVIGFAIGAFVLFQIRRYFSK